MDLSHLLENDPQLVELGGSIFVAKFFQYIANWAALATGNGVAAGTQSIQIDSDADFQLLYLIGNRDNVPLTAQIAEGGAGGLQWSSAPVNFDNMFGTAQLPFPVGLIPQLLPRKRTYNIIMLNTSGGAINVQAAFTGYKLYPASQISSIGAQPSE